MPSLAEDQKRFISCLQKGPTFFPQEMFAESEERALLGLKAHANTISHARLMALEDAYPKLHEHMGHEEFHAISREYVEQDHILTYDLNTIARGFANFLAERETGNTEVDLARVEWAWIESYHSEDAAALELTEIAGLEEESLLDMGVAGHPAMRLINLTGLLSPELSELGDAAPEALMIARPQVDVLFHRISETDFAIAVKLANIGTMGNLLEKAIELGGETGAMDRIIRFIQAGVLIKTRDGQDDEDD